MTRLTGPIGLAIASVLALTSGTVSEGATGAAPDRVLQIANYPWGQEPSYSCALFASGALHCWGRGAGSAPLPDDLPAVTRVAIGQSNGYTAGACAVTVSKSVRCWGTYAQADVPTDLADVTDISALGRSVCALKTSGAVVCWGDAPPVPTGLPAVRSIASWDTATCAVTISGAPLCWGADLGTRKPPSDATAISKLALAYQSMCAVTLTGRVRCWGDRGYTASPASLAGITDAVDITAGGYAFCVQRKSGQVKCFGAMLPPNMPDASTRVDAIAVSGFMGTKYVLWADVNGVVHASSNRANASWWRQTGLAPRASNTNVSAQDMGASAGWNPDGNFAEVEYTATATPGGNSCTSEGSTCMIHGLTNQIDYQVTVAAKLPWLQCDSCQEVASVTPVSAKFQIWSPAKLYPRGQQVTLRIAHAVPNGFVEIKAGAFSQLLASDNSGKLQATFMPSESGVLQTSATFTDTSGVTFTASTSLYVAQIALPAGNVRVGKSAVFTAVGLPPKTVLTVGVVGVGSSDSTAGSNGNARVALKVGGKVKPGKYKWTATAAGVLVGMGKLTIAK